MNEGVQGVEVTVEVIACDDEEQTLFAVMWAAKQNTHRYDAYMQSARHSATRGKTYSATHNTRQIACDAMTAVASIAIDITPEVIYG